MWPGIASGLGDLTAAFRAVVYGGGKDSGREGRDKQMPLHFVGDTQVDTGARR